MDRMRFVFSVCRLVSRRCHNISSILKLHSSPSQNRTSGFPNIRLFGLSFSEPPLYDMGSGLCGYSVLASPPMLTRG
jgi:hypothetical protein